MSYEAVITYFLGENCAEISELQRNDMVYNKNKYVHYQNIIGFYVLFRLEHSLKLEFVFLILLKLDFCAAENTFILNL